MSFKIKVYKEKWVFGLDPSKTLKFQRFPVAKNAKKSGQKVGTKVGRDIFAIFAIFQSPLFLTKSPLFTTKNGLKINFFTTFLTYFSSIFYNSSSSSYSFLSNIISNTTTITTMTTTIGHKNTIGKASKPLLELINKPNPIIM